MVEPGTILSAVDLCFKLGVQIAKACEAWKHADSEVRERMVRLDLYWAQTRTQLDFMRKIAQTIDGELLETMENVLGLLAAKLTLVSSKLDKLLECSGSTPTSASILKVKRGRYAITKAAFDATMDDLEKWQKRFDPCWFLMLRIASPLIDQELREMNESDTIARQDHPKLGISAITSSKSPVSVADGLRDALRDSPQRSASVFLPFDASLELSLIPFSPIRLALRHSNNNTQAKQYIVDRFDIPPHSDQHAVRRDARDMARKLANSDPDTFGLLRAKGVMSMHGQNSQQAEQFNFIYYVPEGLKSPQSLRQVLVQSHDCLHLSQKVRIARDLATSVGFVHNFNFVHKNIHPESVLLFERPGDASMATFLVGFECFRSADAGSLKKGDADWHKDLYRHPTRQGLNPEASYAMQHDIYSLGVCLLELGLSTSFVSYDDGKPQKGPVLAQMEQDGVSDDGTVKDSTLPPEMTKTYQIKNSLLSLTKTKLSRRMGPRYASVVATCLTCLDADNKDFGDESEMTDEDGIIVGVRFIEKIITKLNDITV
ncbi:hypothetical protein PG987_009885 [Apiospora arundinis]